MFFSKRAFNAPSTSLRSFGLSLRSYQFAVSTPFGVNPSVHPRSRHRTNMRVSHLSEAHRNRKELEPRHPDFPIPTACEASEADFLAPTEKPAVLCGSTLPPPPGSVQSSESLLRASGDSADYRVSDHHLTA